MTYVTTLADMRGTDRETFHVEPGTTAAQLRERFWRDDWAAAERVAVIVDGRLVEGTEADIPIAEHSHAILVPAPAEGITWGYILTQVLIAAVSSVVAYALQPRPNLNALGRDDEASQTYQFAIGTDYRQGLLRPIVFGNHDVGGTVIYLDVSPIGTGFNEQLNMVLALCRGPVHAIGGVKADRDGMGGWPFGPPGSGQMPEGIRLNGATLPTTANTTGAYGFTRRGHLNQDPMPDSFETITGFPGITTTLVVNKEIPDLGSTDFTFTPTHDATGFSVLLHFPSGMYATHTTTGELLQAASSYQVDVFDSSAQVIFTGRGGVDGQTRSPFTKELLFPTAPLRGGQPFTVRISEFFQYPPNLRVDSAIFRQVKYNQPSELAYPQTALLGLVAQGGDNIAGGRPSVVTNVSGVPVRVWDETHLGGLPSGHWVDGEQTDRPGGGWYWDLPTLGSAYLGTWIYPPGQNPAWLAVEFATNPRWGMGARFDDDRIDWPAWRNFADFCDRTVTIGAATEMGNACNFVLDQATAGWEVLLRICSAGRGVPLLVGDKLSVRYNYALAHGRGTNSVPAKTFTQVISSANVRDFQVSYLNPRSRPGMLSMQILDEDEQFSQTTVSREDPNGDFHNPIGFRPDPYRKETIDGFGITRKTQAARELLFMHAANRLIRSEVTFEIGPEALAATIGDVIAVQHFALRPYETDSYGYRAAESTSAASIKLDHDVTLEGSKSYVVLVREADSDLTEFAVIGGTSGAFTAGTAIPLGANCEVQKGRVVVFGESTRTTKNYEIRDISLSADLTRRVVAHEFHPDVYADPDVGSAATFDAGSADASLAVAPANTFTENLQEPSVPITAAIVRGMSRRHHTVGFAGDLASASGTVADKARFYARESGTEGAYRFLGESNGTSIEVEGLTPHAAYDLAVSQPNALGFWPPPSLGLTVEAVRVPEFPAFTPPAPGAPQATVVFEGHLLTWEPSDFDGLQYYEVRETNASDPHWHGAQVIGRTVDLQMMAPPLRGSAWAIRARHRSGLWSDAAILSGSGDPQGEAELTFGAGYTYTAFPAYTDVTDNAGTLTLDDGKTEGSFTATIAMGSSQEARLLLPGYTWWDDDVTLDDVDEEFGFATDSGEMHWWEADGRESSPAYPGCDFDLTFAAIDAMTDAEQDLLTAGGARPGFEGDQARVRFLVSYDGGDFELYQPRRKVWQTAAVRIEFDRVTTRHTAYLAGLSLRVFTP